MQLALSRPARSSRPVVQARRNGAASRVSPRPKKDVLHQFVTSQAVNARRDAAALRPFYTDEFGTDAASPSRAHIEAANELIAALRRQLLRRAETVGSAGETALQAPRRRDLQRLLQEKEQTLRWIKLIEKIWDFYLEMFGQRQTRFGDWLLAADRVALDCYQVVYTGLGRVRPIPAPPPFSYMQTGFTPSTFRRGVRLSRLGKNANPFPVVQLPYHRLVNPWTLGAIHHEVSHNIQSDLGLWQVVPRRIARQLRRAGLPPAVADTWSRWHKEIWADLCGVLLGGPAIVASLLDVLARSPGTTGRFNPGAVHPVPYLRALINFELLRRMGFPHDARAYERIWRHMYPVSRRRDRGLSHELMRTFPRANRMVVDTICFRPYAQLGGRTLAQVVRFQPDYQEMIAEAAQRIAAGNDPGIIPARFLVGAAREVLDRDLAPPGRIAVNFYQALVKR